MSIDRRTVLAGSAGMWILGAGMARAAPKPRLISRRWTNFGSGQGPDHGAWDQILSRHVSIPADGIARFDYRRADAAAVQRYVAGLAAVDPTGLTSAAAFAYWVNLYNAVTIATVLGAYPVRSIRQIGGNVLSPGPWREKRVEVAGDALSLDDIEHGILRPIWRDARVHYAVNCAALGCPNLAGRAFTAGRLPRMLDKGARAYVNHPRGVSIREGRLVVSSIYRWFDEDFGGSATGTIAHLKQYAEPGLAAALESVTRIADDRYDWGLNGAAWR